MSRGAKSAKAESKRPPIGVEVELPAGVITVPLPLEADVPYGVDEQPVEFLNLEELGKFRATDDYALAAGTPWIAHEGTSLSLDAHTREWWGSASNTGYIGRGETEQAAVYDLLQRIALRECLKRREAKATPGGFAPR